MEQSVSRVLVEMAVKTALKNIHDSPERGIRNLVDMALQCAEGRFQHSFFATAQTMLQNEDSAYYELVRDTVAHTDPGRLYTFGMNLGYNACTVGARHIRENEKKLGQHSLGSGASDGTPAAGGVPTGRSGGGGAGDLYVDAFRRQAAGKAAPPGGGPS